MDQPTRGMIRLHLVFAIVAAAGILLPISTLGTHILLLVLAYNLALPYFAHHRAYTKIVDVWKFLLPLSISMVLPDWFLADVLQVLVFPNTGTIFIGPIPLFMMGMWLIPLFLIVYVSTQIEASRGRWAATITAAVLSLLVFAGAEATLWAVPIWYAQNVMQVGHVAWYVLVPEVLLGVSAYLLFQQTRNAGLWTRLCGAWIVMVLYLGHLCLFYLLLE